MTQLFTALLINLDRDTDRRSHMERQLQAAGIDYARQPGILGDDLPDELRPFFFHADGRPKTTMKRGEIGCYASHLRILQRAARGDLGPYVLVMEDDLDLPPDLTALITEALQAMPLGWDILRLSSPSRRSFVPVAALRNGRALIRYSKIPNSAGAYLVTQAGAQKFVQCGVRGLTFDDDLRRPWFHGMKTYGIMPPPVKAGMLKSSIDAVEAGRFDKPVSSPVERLLRGDHLHLFRRMGYNIRDLGLSDWLRCGFANLTGMATKSVRKA